MPTIKQKTIGGRTYELKQHDTDRPGKQHEYFVTEDGQRIDDPVYTRAAGERQFEETVSAIRRAEGEDRARDRGPSLPGLGGGPPAGGFLFGDEPDDDDGPYFPGF